MADLHKITSAEFRGFDANKLRETQTDIAKEMAKIRMDIYTARNQHTAKIRGLRKTLARLLTVKTEQARANPKPAKAAAPKAAAKPAKVKAAKPKTEKVEAKAAAPKKAKTAK